MKVLAPCVTAAAFEVAAAAGLPEDAVGEPVETVLETVVEAELLEAADEVGELVKVEGKLVAVKVTPTAAHSSRASARAVCSSEPHVA